MGNDALRPFASLVSQEKELPTRLGRHVVRNVREDSWLETHIELSSPASVGSSPGKQPNSSKEIFPFPTRQQNSINYGFYRANQQKINSERNRHFVFGRARTRAPRSPL